MKSFSAGIFKVAMNPYMLSPVAVLKLQFDETKRVRKTLVHVIGPVSYKKGCLETDRTVKEMEKYIG